MKRETRCSLVRRILQGTNISVEADFYVFIYLLSIFKIIFAKKKRKKKKKKMEMSQRSQKISFSRERTLDSSKLRQRKR